MVENSTNLEKNMFYLFYSLYPILKFKYRRAYSGLQTNNPTLDTCIQLHSLNMGSFACLLVLYTVIRHSVPYIFNNLPNLSSFSANELMFSVLQSSKSRILFAAMYHSLKWAYTAGSIWNIWRGMNKYCNVFMNKIVHLKYYIIKQYSCLNLLNVSIQFSGLGSQFVSWILRFGIWPSLCCLPMVWPFACSLDIDFWSLSWTWLPTLFIKDQKLWLDPYLLIICSYTDTVMLLLLKSWIQLCVGG